MMMYDTNGEVKRSGQVQKESEEDININEYLQWKMKSILKIQRNEKR